MSNIIAKLNVSRLWQIAKAKTIKGRASGLGPTGGLVQWLSKGAGMRHISKIQGGSL